MLSLRHTHTQTHMPALCEHTHTLFLHTLTYTYAITDHLSLSPPPTHTHPPYRPPSFSLSLARSLAARARALSLSCNISTTIPPLLPQHFCFSGMTGTPEQILKVGKAFRVYFTKARLSDKPGSPLCGCARGCGFGVWVCGCGCGCGCVWVCDWSKACHSTLTKPVYTSACLHKLLAWTELKYLF